MGLIDDNCQIDVTYTVLQIYYNFHHQRQNDILVYILAFGQNDVQMLLS